MEWNCSSDFDITLQLYDSRLRQIFQNPETMAHYPMVSFHGDGS